MTSASPRGAAPIPISEVRNVLRGSIDAGWRNPPVRALMLGGLFTGGVTFFAFYASQPYLLQLYGDPNAYSVAGLTAAVFAGAQILGGVLVPYVRRLFRRRTDGVLLSAVGTVGIMAVIGIDDELHRRPGVARGMGDAVRGDVASTSGVHQRHHPVRATRDGAVVRFVVSSIGGPVSQPALGRVSDVFGYGPAYVVTAVMQACAIPFVLLARRERAASDPIEA